MADLLWLKVTNRKTYDDDGKPLIKMWHEIINPQPEEKPIEMTKEMMIEHIKSLRIKKK